MGIAFVTYDAEDTCVVRLFAATAVDPLAGQQYAILSGLIVEPGAYSGEAVWNTSAIPVGAYNIFAEMDDGTYDSSTGAGNLPVLVTTTDFIQIGPAGSSPLPMPPRLVFIDPVANLGLSVADDMTIRYIYSDPDSEVTVTLLLDTDQNPLNDDIDNPGDPQHPDAKIIILPSVQRLETDPVFPDENDTRLLRTNPRSLGQTPPNALPYPGAPMAGVLKEYRFAIDLSRIPVRIRPYYMRATISDGLATQHYYAVGSLTITSLATGVVNVGNVGFSLAGGRFQGFSQHENLGTNFAALGDLDLDGVEDFMIASRFGRPKNRPGVPGAAYLLFGRSKVPFPPDSNGNGIPDVTTPDGVIDYPPPPDFLPNPYDARNVGRFGGVLNVNSINNFFRGTIYGMPLSWSVGDLPPPAGQEVPAEYAVPFFQSAGLTSITRLDMTGDGTPDLVFGLPFSSTYDSADDDPSDGCPSGPYSMSNFLNEMLPDRLPNADRCDIIPNDDMGIIEQGLVIMVDGRTDTRNIFRRFVDAGIAGQHEPGGRLDDEGLPQSGPFIPTGMRFRGGWHSWVRTDEPGVEIDPLNEFGTTVAAMPSIDNDIGEELLISSPGYAGQMRDMPDQGMVWLFLTNDFLSASAYGEDTVRSSPGYTLCGESCPGDICCRACVVFPSLRLHGSRSGDRFGYAGPAGQFNQDGTPDILAGSPGSDRDGLADNGIFYVVFTPQGGFFSSQVEALPHLRVTGVNNGDRFGRVQTEIRDINGDGISDVAFASERWDDTLGPDQGYVGIIFGWRPLTGENGFTPFQVGTPDLPGIRFMGAQAGDRAGHDITSAGDFNNDGWGDLLISAPGAAYIVEGQMHRGVVYLIFGGPHLNPGHECNSNPMSANDNVFSLSQVSTPALPGIVFYGRIVEGADPLETNATLQYVGGLGDVDGDGFDDIAIGAPKIDFINPAAPVQRRIDAGEVYVIYGSNYGTNNVPGNYFDYPTSSNSVPSDEMINPDPGNNATFYDKGDTIGGPYWYTEVGAHENPHSP